MGVFYIYIYIYMYCVYTHAAQYVAIVAGCVFVRVVVAFVGLLPVLHVKRISSIHLYCFTTYVQTNIFQLLSFHVLL